MSHAAVVARVCLPQPLPAQDDPHVASRLRHFPRAQPPFARAASAAAAVCVRGRGADSAGSVGPRGEC